MLIVCLIFRQKVNGEVKKICRVPKAYVHFVVGKGHKNIDQLATKSGTKIRAPSRRKSEGRPGSFYIDRFTVLYKRFVCMLL